MKNPLCRAAEGVKLSGRELRLSPEHPVLRKERGRIQRLMSFVPDTMIVPDAFRVMLDNLRTFYEVFVNTEKVRFRRCGNGLFGRNYLRRPR